MKRSTIPFWAAAAVLLAVIITLPSDGFFSADSGSKYWQMLAFAEGQGRPRTFEYPAAGLDPRFRHAPEFTAEVDGRLASVYPVLFPLLTAGPVVVFGDRALRAVPWLAGLAAAWMAGLMASTIRGRDVTGPVAAVTLAATPLAFYSVTFWEHSLAALLVVAGLLGVVGSRPDVDVPVRRWAALGLAVGLAAWFRTEIALLSPTLLLALVVVSRRRRLVSAAAGIAGFATGVLAGALVQFAALGRWVPLHVAYHLESSFRTYPFVSSRLEALLSFLAPDWSAGLAAVVWLFALAVVVTRRGSQSRFGLVAAIAAVGCSLVAALVVPSIQWLGGVRPTEAFPYAAPAATWLVLSALPVVLWRQDRAVLIDRRRLLPLAVAGWLPAAVLTVRAVRSFEWGGRLFLPTVVTLVAVMGSFPCAAGPLRALRRSVISVAVVVAVVIQVAGLVLVHHGIATHARIAAEVSAFVDPCEPVITDAYQVPLVAGRTWTASRFLYCTMQPNLPQLLARIGAEGSDRWTYATVLRAPGSRLETDALMVGDDGQRWLLIDRLDRHVRTQTLRLKRYRKVGVGRLAE